MNDRLAAKLSAEPRSEIVAESIRDVKPAERGTVDESWYLFATVDGRWHTCSDESGQLETHAGEEAAEAYWAEAEEAWAVLDD